MAKCEDSDPEAAPPKYGKMGKEKKKQEKALALSQRQGSHFPPQCGRLRGAEADAFPEG